jgi:hypothetical protein
MPDGDDNGSGSRMDSGGPRDNGDGRGGGQRNFNNSRRKRRRQRPQRGKRHKGGGGGGGGHSKSAGLKDDTDRERIFQDIEGLLRRIREEAEEMGGRSEQELADVTATVTNFTKILEEEAEVVSERARVEYHRVREKLNHALRS